MALAGTRIPLVEGRSDLIISAAADVGFGHGMSLQKQPNWSKLCVATSGAAHNTLEYFTHMNVERHGATVNLVKWDVLLCSRYALVITHDWVFPLQGQEGSLKHCTGLGSGSHVRLLIVAPLVGGPAPEISLGCSVPRAAEGAEGLPNGPYGPSMEAASAERAQNIAPSGHESASATIPCTVHLNAL